MSLEKKMEEILENGFEMEVEVEETRENLGWGFISRSFLIITG